MAHLAYQGGPSIELFTAAGSKPLEDLRLTVPKAVKREYDKGLKAACIVIDGDVAPSCRVSVPACPKAALGLRHPVVVLQVCAAPASPLFFEFACTDGKTRRRIVMSTATHRASVDPLHVKLPLGKGVVRGRWVNLCFDVLSIFSHAFDTVAMVSIDSITIGPACRVRKIVSLREGASILQDKIVPPCLDFPSGVLHATVYVRLPPRERKKHVPREPPVLIFEVVEPAQADGGTVPQQHHALPRRPPQQATPAEPAPPRGQHPAAQAAPAQAAVQQPCPPPAAQRGIGQRHQQQQQQQHAVPQAQVLWDEPRAYNPAAYTSALQQQPDAVTEVSRMDRTEVDTSVPAVAGQGQGLPPAPWRDALARGAAEASRPLPRASRAAAVQTTLHVDPSADLSHEVSSSGGTEASQLLCRDLSEHDVRPQQQHHHHLDRTEDVSLCSVGAQPRQSRQALSACGINTAGGAAAPPMQAGEVRQAGVPPGAVLGRRSSSARVSVASCDGEEDNYSMQLLRDLRLMEMEITHSTREIEAGLQQQETLLLDDDFSLDGVSDGGHPAEQPGGAAQSPPPTPPHPQQRQERHSAAWSLGSPGSVEAPQGWCAEEGRGGVSRGPLAAWGEGLDSEAAGGPVPPAVDALQGVMDTTDRTQPCTDSPGARTGGSRATSAASGQDALATGPELSQHSPHRTQRTRPDPMALSSVDRKLMKVNQEGGAPAMASSRKEAVRRSLLDAVEVAPTSTNTYQGVPPSDPLSLPAAAVHCSLPPSLAALDARNVLHVDLPMPMRSCEVDTTSEYERAEEACGLPPKGLSYSMSTYDSHSDRSTPSAQAHPGRWRRSAQQGRAAHDPTLPTPTSEVRVRGFRFNNSTLNEYSADLPTPMVGKRDDESDECCRFGGNSAILGLSPAGSARDAQAMRLTPGEARQAQQRLLRPAEGWGPTDDMGDVVVFESCVLRDSGSELSDWSASEHGHQAVPAEPSPQRVAEAAKPERPTAGQAFAPPGPQRRTLLYDPSQRVYYDPATNEYFDTE